MQCDLHICTVGRSKKHKRWKYWFFLRWFRTASHSRLWHTSKNWVLSNIIVRNWANVITESRNWAFFVFSSFLDNFQHFLIWFLKSSHQGFQNNFRNSDWFNIVARNWANIFSHYAGATNLRTHLKTHSADKSSKCNQCDFASSYASSLGRHSKTHTGEKSNKCNQCDFASCWADSLRTHLKTHSGEKSNKCNQCDYASSQA